MDCNTQFCEGYTLCNKKCKNKKYKNYNYCYLHHNKYKFEKPNECSICMESLENVNIPLSCGHWVHKECIIKWGKVLCPICKTDIKMSRNDINKIHTINRNKRRDEFMRNIRQNINNNRSNTFLEIVYLVNYNELNNENSLNLDIIFRELIDELNIRNMLDIYEQDNNQEINEHNNENNIDEEYEQNNNEIIQDT